MDAWLWHPLAPEDIALDFTIRHPLASSNKAAIPGPGDAIKKAVNEKKRRYSGKVLPVPMETFGRMGDEIVMLLKHLDQVGDWGTVLGSASDPGIPGGSRTQWWAALLQATLATTCPRRADLP